MQSVDGWAVFFIFWRSLLFYLRKVLFSVLMFFEGAGKSCLLHQFVENKFKKGSAHTIGTFSLLHKIK